MLKSIPKFRGTNPVGILLNFYEDLGWDREKTLDPTKVKMNKVDRQELYDKMVQIGQMIGIEREGIGLVMLDKGPSVDDTVPKGKVLWTKKTLKTIKNER